MRAALAAVAVLVLAALPAGPAAAAGAVEAARALVEATPAGERAALNLPFTEAARTDWHYTPRRRDGIPWKAMDPKQREAATALMRSALSDAGLAKVRSIITLEIVLREVEAFGFSRDPDNYAFALFGTPEGGNAGWGWRVEGHHLSLHFSLAGDRYVATLPQFMGANPATLARDFPKAGMRKGQRVLGAEEDLARELLTSLDAKQRSRAVFDARPYGDIVTTNAARVAPLAPVGIGFDELTAAQQALLLRLVSVFADHLRPDLADARLARVREGGLPSLRFGWAGSAEAGAPHYFRIQGARVLIEFDNSGGNHVHSVWRDFDGDWGRDVLREHYRRASGTAHVHGTSQRVAP